MSQSLHTSSTKPSEPPSRSLVKIASTQHANRAQSTRHMPPRKPRPTHFLCIPLVTSQSQSQLQKSLQGLRDEVEKAKSSKKADKHNDAAIDAAADLCVIPEGAIRPLGTLHLTLGVMSLVEEDGVERVKGLLKGLDLDGMLRRIEAGKHEEAKSTEVDITSAASPLKINLRSLHAMKSASRTSVLYASPHDSSARLEQFCETLRRVFMDAGLMESDERPLRLHATIVNTIYARKEKTGKGDEKEKKAGRGRQNGPNVNFDARGWIRKYDGYAWAEDIVVDSVAICKMGAEKVKGMEEARYTEIAAARFRKS